MARPQSPEALEKARRNPCLYLSQKGCFFHSADVLLGHQMSKSGLLIWSFFFLVAVGSPHAAFAQKPNEIFEGILDLLDQAQKLKKEQTLEQREEEEGPQGQEPTYSVDGIGIGELVDLKKNYSCKPSEQFSGFDWCSATSRTRSARGSFEQKTTLLRSIDGRAYYINRFITPAFFAPNEVDRDIERLTQRFGAKPTILLMPKRAGLPQAIIATWGDLKLKALDNAGREALIEGQSPKQGILVDFLNDFTTSAKERLPIYFLEGGAGYVWIATPINNGRGKLRFLAVDPRALDTSPPIQVVDKERSESDTNGGGNPHSMVQEDATAPQFDSDGRQAENSRDVERKKIVEENRLTAEQAARQAPPEWKKNSTLENTTTRSSPPSDLTASDEVAVERDVQERSVEEAIALATARIRQEEDEAANQRRQSFDAEQERLRAHTEADIAKRRKFAARSASAEDMRKFDQQQRDFLTQLLKQREQRQSALEQSLAMTIEKRVAAEEARIRGEAAKQEQLKQYYREQEQSEQEQRKFEQIELEKENARQELEAKELIEQQQRELEAQKKQEERWEEERRAQEEQHRLEAQRERAAEEKEKKEQAEKRRQEHKRAVALAESKGPEYAAKAETRWDVVTRHDDMTDRMEVRVKSIQKNSQGVIVELEGWCEAPGDVHFSALYVDEDGQPTVQFEGRANASGGAVARTRVNEDQARNVTLPSIGFFNKLLLGSFRFEVSESGKPEAKSNGSGFEANADFAKLIAAAFGAYSIIFADETWRYMAEVDTDRGSVLVKIPLFDEAIRKLFSSCSASTTSQNQKESEGIE